MAEVSGSESTHGTTITLHSDANSDVYKGNCTSNFTNILKIPIKLQHDTEFEVGLGNVHIPNEQSILLKEDDETSFIQYNLGMFDHNNATGGWDLLQGSHKVLWKYVPNKDFVGVDAESNILKADFINRLSESLVLSNHTKVNIKALDTFQIALFHYYNLTGDHTENGDFLWNNYCLRCTQALQTSDNIDGHTKLISIFNKYEPGIREGLWFKSLESLKPKDRFKIIEALMSILEIDLKEYFRNVITFLWHDDRKIRINKILDSLRNKQGNVNMSLREYYNHSLFKNLWPDQENPPILAVYITFGSRLENFLSVPRNSRYFIGTCTSHKSFDIYNSNTILKPKFDKKKIDTFFIYSDIVKKTVRLGSHLTNLLGIITVNKNIVNLSNPISIYRPMAHNYFHSASIIITDQYGDKPNFEDGSFSTIELVIRRKQI